VRGEIHSISDQSRRSGHCYFDLIDPDSSGERQPPVLRVKCWSRTWSGIRPALEQAGVSLEPGMVVVLRGSIDFYRPKAELGFILVEIDVTALLGRLAAQRAALLKALDAEGLLERNRRLAVPPVPVRVGLVASPGTEGYRDFLGQLTGSGFAFEVVMSPATVQGAAAPRSIARALSKVASSGSCDLVVMVRGGGAKADLAAFDTEPVARAVASSPVPVWTGIGHTGDESVADIVANRSFVTPTECGAELARVVAAWWDATLEAAGTVVRRAVEVVTDAQSRDAAARVRLTGAARHQLRAHGERLTHRSLGLARRAPEVLAATAGSVEARAARLSPAARNHVERGTERLEHWRRLLAAYDVEQQLARGYTLTLDDEGRIVRSAAELREGQVVRTRFSDGAAGSRVEAIEVKDAPSPAEPGTPMEGREA
jgi:exodeoxyribonuclease VII large subunit